MSATEFAANGASPADIGFEWDTTPRAAWETMVAAIGKSSLQQSWGFGETVHALKGYQILRGVAQKDGQPISIVQVVRKRLAGILSLSQVTRGPLWLTQQITDSEKLRVFELIVERLRRRRRDIVVWMPEAIDKPENQTLLRAAGLRRMITGYSSVWIDLSQTPAALRARLHGKWRNTLGTVEAKRLAVDATENMQQVSWLIDNYDTFRRRRRFTAPNARLLRTLAHSVGTENRVVLRAMEADEPIAGILLIRHGASATYVAGWTSQAGRQRHAHNLLLWQGIGELQRRGVAWLDLGGVNSHDAPGVARFKLGMGGELYTLAGLYM